MEPKVYKSIWISDLHLGTKGASARELLAFLRNTESENLFLVGDIIDMWQLSKKWYWPKVHNEVVQKILRKSRKGTRVIYIPGNHDETVRDYLPLMLGDVEVVQEYDYITASGKRMLVTHGDLYDIITTYHKWLARLGDWGYVTLIEINRYLNWFRRKFKMGYWSLSRYVKTKVKNAASFIGKFEESLAEACRIRNYDGIIAGHIHHAEIRMIDGILYMNDGDFVESRTALAEHHDGRFVLLEWREGQLLELATWEPGLETAHIYEQPIVLLEDKL
jgi:UDP-2,3-diacylglucosamine pyrophosphatase LpxH